MLTDSDGAFDGALVGSSVSESDGDGDDVKSESDGDGGSTGDDTCACESCVDCPINTWRDASRQADGCFLATGYTRSGRDSLCAP